jgi:hypothetical protein
MLRYTNNNSFFTLQFLYTLKIFSPVYINIRYHLILLSRNISWVTLKVESLEVLSLEIESFFILGPFRSRVLSISVVRSYCRSLEVGSLEVQSLNQNPSFCTRKRKTK